MDEPVDAERSEVGEAALAVKSYAQTRYPIVLCHGMAGFQAMFGVVDYFGGIASALRSGGAEVYATAVPQFDSTEARGEALLAQIEDIVARTGSGKVNLVGHSHGGLDARYVAAVRPDLIASVTTIGSPHQGAELASYLQDHLQEGGFAQGALSFLANSLGTVLSLLSGHPSPQDAMAAVRSLSAAGMREFNARYPAGLPDSRCGQGPDEEGGVRFFSWSGTGIVTSLLDPTDLSFGLISRLYSESNDGMVGRCSSHFGEVVRDDYGMNHLDEVNQLFGFINLSGPNPKSVFRSHASRLKGFGL
ncbi:esterase/lipase family protein [Sorangium sp. So ce1000]|uniref:esterase/lipase family protein n=1 Tax=Sorangium sp. So ce1000 TaxID=3133325 RepID=UPI003F643C79